MSTETLEIRQLARQFAESELRPHVEKWDHDGAIDAAVLAQLAELGFAGMLVPEAYGGMAFDLPTYVAALEELAWGEPAIALRIALTSTVADLLVTHGTDEQKRRWLEAIARGEEACIARSEPDGTETHARRAGDEWQITGTKKWVTNGRAARLALVTARADEGATAFLIPVGGAGYSVARRESTLGLRPLEIVTVMLEDVRVDADDVLAVSADDTAYSVVGLLGVAAIAVGIAQAAFDHARGYADVREQFGTRLREFEGLQFKLADMTVRTTTARLLLQYAAAESGLQAAAMAKVLASETAMSVTTDAVQVFGGYGYMRDYPVEKLMRDAKATEMLQASNEDLRVVIARDLYT